MRSGDACSRNRDDGLPPGRNHLRLSDCFLDTRHWLYSSGRQSPARNGHWYFQIFAFPSAPSCIISLPLNSLCNRIPMRIIIFSLIAGSLFFNNVWADHEADHRYNIRGYVLSADQKGIDNLTVEAFADGELLSTGRTDADGYYSLHLHLHNSDLHRILKLRAGSYEADLRVTFDVKDDTSARIHEANFVGGSFIEGDLDRFRVPSWSYAVGGLLLFMVILVFLERRRKNKIRQAKYGASETSPPRGHKGKKSRRKKH